MELKFTKELKSNWLEALKSGKFKQGKGLLRDNNNKYCCIGVLCVVLGQEDELISKNGGCALDTDIYGMLDKNIGYNEVENLWRTNDNVANSMGDYSNVIPIIEDLPTVD